MKLQDFANLLESSLDSRYFEIIYRESDILVKPDLVGGILYGSTLHDLQPFFLNQNLIKYYFDIDNKYFVFYE